MRHPLTLRVLGKNYVNKVEKVEKTSEIYVQIICKSSDPDLIICEVSKQLTKNCKRSCIHKTPTDYKGCR